MPDLTTNKHGLGVRYFKEKLSSILQHIDIYKPDEMYRELDKLSRIAGEQMMAKLAQKRIDTKKEKKISPRYDPQRRCMTRCQADDDGHCDWDSCPQLRDNEPANTNRHCPLDQIESD